MKEVQILVDVSSTGDTTIEARGFADAACLKETQSLEEALGKVNGRTKKAEASIPHIADKTTVGIKS